MKRKRRSSLGGEMQLLVECALRPTALKFRSQDERDVGLGRVVSIPRGWLHDRAFSLGVADPDGFLLRTHEMVDASFAHVEGDRKTSFSRSYRMRPEWVSTLSDEIARAEQEASQMVENWVSPG